ncbi:helix-turn-helix domain-containing protein [Terrabacter terrigena]|uniref:Helix-turn-helix domain-containing protein n=1 Tax=Terrabacter terrigena TaxID=574718 RepID=A0ABW3N0P3_9MICO
MDAQGRSTEDFDAARYAARARRVADLSQRELAELLGLSRATVGRIESGAVRVDIATLASILTVAGLRLAVLDHSGAEVPPIPVDVLRDHAGRRLPSHLDARPPVDEPADRGIDPRRGRPPALAWFEQRDRRQRRRARRGTPADHPTVSGVREEKAAARRRALEAAAAREAVSPTPECQCLDDCFERACLASCTCQCEPGRSIWTRTTS